MKAKRIVSIILILCMFILILPREALAKFVPSGKGVTWEWTNMNVDIPFKEYASGKFTYNYNVWDEGDRDWDSYTSNYWIEEEDLMDGYYRRILINDRATYKSLNDEKISKFKIGETHEASHLESYILSFADIDDDDNSVKDYFHDLAQEAWYDYQEGDRSSAKVLDNAYDYQSWVEMLEDEMGKDLSDASDSEINEAIEGQYDFDTKDSIVSVVHENDSDYMLISNLTVKGIDHADIRHYKNDDDDEWESTGSFKPAVKDISIVFTTENGDKTIETLNHSDITDVNKIFEVRREDGSIMENAITLEYENLEAHKNTSSRNDYCQSGSCPYDCGDEHRLFPNLPYYPFPFGGEKVNLKFSAEFVKAYKVTGVASISIVSDTSRGILKTWYTELEPGDLSEGESKTRMYTSDFKTREIKGSDYYSEVGIDYNYTTGSALGLVDGDSNVTIINTDEMLGMSEKSIEEFEGDVAIDVSGTVTVCSLKVQEQYNKAMNANTFEATVTYWTNMINFIKQGEWCNNRDVLDNDIARKASSLLDDGCISSANEGALNHYYNFLNDSSMHSSSSWKYLNECKAKIEKYKKSLELMGQYDNYSSIYQKAMRAKSKSSEYLNGLEKYYNELKQFEKFGNALSKTQYQTVLSSVSGMISNLKEYYNKMAGKISGIPESEGGTGAGYTALDSSWVQFIGQGPSRTLGQAWIGGNTTGLTYNGSTLTFDGQSKNNMFTIGVCFEGTTLSTPGATASKPYINEDISVAKTYTFTVTGGNRTYTWKFGSYNMTVIFKNIPSSSSSTGGGSGTGTGSGSSTGTGSSKTETKQDTAIHTSNETKSSDGKISLKVQYKNVGYDNYLRLYSEPQLSGDWYNFTLQAPNGLDDFTINGNPFSSASAYSKAVESHSEYATVNNVLKYSVDGNRIGFNIKAEAIEDCVSAGNSLTIEYKTKNVTEWTKIYVVKNASLTSDVNSNTVKVENTSNVSSEINSNSAIPLQGEDTYMSGPTATGDYEPYYVKVVSSKASLSDRDMVLLLTVDKTENYKTESIKCTKTDGTVVNIDPTDKSKVESYVPDDGGQITYKIKDTDIAKYSSVVINYSNANGKVQSSIRVDSYHNVTVTKETKNSEENKKVEDYVKSSDDGYEVCFGGIVYKIIPEGTYGNYGNKGEQYYHEAEKLGIKKDSVKTNSNGDIIFEVEYNGDYTISGAYNTSYSEVSGWTKFHSQYYDSSRKLGNSKVTISKDYLKNNKNYLVGFLMSGKNPRGGDNLEYMPTVKVTKVGEVTTGDKDNSIGSGKINGITLSFYASGAYNKDGDTIKSIDSNSIKIENGNLVFNLNDKVFSNAYMAKYNEQHAGWTKLNLSNGTIYYYGKTDLLKNGNQITLYNIEDEIKSGIHTYYILLKNGEYYSIITINTTGSDVKGDRVTGQNSEFKLEGVAYSEDGSISIDSDLKNNYSVNGDKVTFTVPYSPSKNGDSISNGENDSKLSADAKADGGKMVITINKSNFYSCPDGYYEVKNGNNTAIASLYIHYIGTKAAASKYTEKIGAFTYTVNNPSSLVDIGIDTKVLYENGNNYDESRYKNLLFPINSIGEGYSLKSWTASYDNGGVSIDIKDNKYLRIVNGTPYKEEIKYYVTFSKGSDEQVVEIIIQRVNVTINQTPLSIGGNVWVEGAAGIDPDYIDKEDCDMLSITKNSDFIINNLDMKEYFNEGKVTNEQLKEKLSDFTAYLKTDQPVDLGIENEDYEFIIIDKKGFIKRDGKHYVQLKFEFDNAVSYEVNYRYVTNSGFYAGDGYKGQMLTTPNGHSIHYTDKKEIATFYLERSGFAVITVKFNDNSIKNIGVFVPTMYIGEINKDGDSYKNYESYDKEWHTREDDLLAKDGQFYVDLNDEEEQELVFYNITGDVELSDYVYNKHTPKAVKGSDGTWVSSKKLWDDYGDDSSIARSEEDNSISQKYMLKEGYRDIEGFGDETEYPEYNEKNEKEIRSNYFLNTDTNAHELRWSFRDSGLEEEDTDHIGTTLFTIVFRGQEQDEGDLDSPLTYLKKIEEYKQDDITKKYEADYEGQWSFKYYIKGDCFIDVPDDKENYDNGYGIKSKNDEPIKEDVWIVLEEYDYKGNLITAHVKPDIEVKDGKYSFDVLPPLSTDGTKHYYSVKAVYDGQKYEPTELLATSAISVGGTDERANRVNTITTIDPGYESKTYYGEYENSSWIAENNGIGNDRYDRNDFDTKDLEVITKDDQQVSYDREQGQFVYTGVEYGYTEGGSMTDNGTTEGTFAKSTLSSKHYIYASTNDGGLKLPLRDADYHLKNSETASLKVMREKNPKGEKHVPVYEYSDNINIGLVLRDESDLSINRDVYKASVIINEQDMNYKYNTFKLKPNENGEIPALSKNYNLGLYSSDIEYSSNVYNEADAIKAIKDATELRAFVTYKITLYNESANTIEKVNELSEYYNDNDHLTLVDSNNYKDEDGKRYSFNDGVDAVVIEKQPAEGDNKYTINRTTHHRVADTSYYRVIRSGNSDYGYNYNKAGDLEGFDNNNGQITWVAAGDVGSGESSYKHLTTTSLGDVKLNPGEMIEVYVTYELDREGFKAAIDHAFEKNGQDNSEREKALVGDKNTVSEISAYSTEYGRRKNNTTAYKVGDNSGKIDRDSRPGNVDLSLENKYQEDDTSYAGKLHVGIEAEQNKIRSISGTVWDDSVYEDPNAQDGTKHYQENGNGVFDSGEKGIENIKVSLIEKVLAENGQEYEFAWPIDNSGNIQDKGYAGSLAQMTNDNGGYKFSGVVPGTYVVRFEYGDKDSKTNGFYTGQNYKNTKYEDNMTNLNQVWQNLDPNAEVNKVRVSDARDYEPARLRTIAYARTISALNGSELKIGCTNGEGTYMRADTARLNIESSIEKDDKLSYVDGTGKYVKTYVTDDGTFTHEYAVENIDFGLEMRPETKVEIDKQLTKITLSKKGTDVFRVNIEYDNDGKLLNTDRAGVSLEDGVAIDKMISLINEAVRADQGFRYVQMETEELKEMAIKLDYNIVATNKSDIDYIGSDLDKLYTMESIYELAYNMENSDVYKNYNSIINYGTNDGVGNSGSYLGSHYYTHDGSGEVVTTTVDQLVDYVDNDIAMDANENNGVENHAWTAVNITNGLDGLFTKDSYDNGVLHDYKKVAYIDSARSNIVLSNNSNIKHLQNGGSSDIIKYNIMRKDIDGTGIKGYEVKMPDETKYQARYKDDDYNPDSTNHVLTKRLLPGDKANIGFSVSETIHGESDADNLKFDNLVEVLVYSNTAGRKDIEATPGNANEVIVKGEGASSTLTWRAGRQGGGERDGDTTEYFTLTPPTGLSVEMERSNNSLVVTIIAAATAMIANITVPIAAVMYDRNRRNSNSELKFDNGSNGDDQ